MKFSRFSLFSFVEHSRDVLVFNLYFFFLLVFSSTVANSAVFSSSQAIAQRLTDGPLNLLIFVFYKFIESL